MADQGGDSAKRSSSKRSASTGALHSISQRVMDSASGLLQDTLSPNSTQPVSTLAHVLASEDKAGPSTVAEAARPETVSERRGGLDVRQVRSSHGTENSFRELVTSNGSIASQSADIAKGMSLDEFMDSAKDGTEMPKGEHSSTSQGKQIASSMDNFPTEHPAPGVEMSAAWNAIVSDESSQALLRNESMEQRGTNEAYQMAGVNETDGAEVLKLLQDPRAAFWVDMPEEEEEEEERIPYTTTEEDMKIAEKIVRYVGMTTISVPDRESMTSAAKRGEPFSAFSSFFDEIENYQNEVWGYLRPLIEEAKRQSSELGSSTAEGGAAVRRLRMILAHVDDSNEPW